jgi:hypothetical protein
MHFNNHLSFGGSKMEAINTKDPGIKAEEKLIVMQIILLTLWNLEKMKHLAMMILSSLVLGRP